MSFSSSQAAADLAAILSGQSSNYLDLFRQIDAAVAEAWTDIEAERSKAQLAADTADQLTATQLEHEIAAALATLEATEEATREGPGLAADYPI